MPVVGANKIKARMKSFVSDVSDKKAMQFVNAVGSSAGILSKEKAPLEYGALHNSQRFDVVKNAGRVIGSLSYNTLYASILNDGKYKWNPRPPANKKGPAWNPNATPHFLEYGFESPEGQAMIKKYLEIFKI
ncbi:hypothetical protein [Pseudoalteromonas phage XCL1123]|nr:hypothetical protein [Pseudoalteromonas phage XCL1123]